MAVTKAWAVLQAWMASLRDLWDVLLLISGKAEEQCELVNRHRKLLGGLRWIPAEPEPGRHYIGGEREGERAHESWDCQEKLHVPQSLGGLVLGPAALQPSLASTCPAS